MSKLLPRIDAPAGKTRRLAELRAARDALDVELGTRYRGDPVAWARDRLGVHLWSRQRDIARSVVENRFTAVQSAAGVGKTYLAAILALWFGTVHALSDVKIVTTAPTSDQVTLLLWGEIRRHHAASDLPGRMLLNDRWVAGDGYVAAYGRKPPDHSQSAFQGAHAGKMLVIVDEAGGIDAPLWAAIRAITTNRDASVLAIGNPDRSASEFARMCQPGTSWTPFKISVFDTPRFTGEQVPEELLEHLPSPEFVDSCRIDWGESSTLYRAKVLGEFSDDADGLIPYSWVVAAQERWRNYWATLATGVEPPGRPLWSCDVATTGDDQTVIVRKQGPVVYELERWAFNEDPIEVAELVRTRVQSVPTSRAVIDSNGEGKGTFAALRRQGVPVTAYIGSKATNRVDSTGTARFERTRSAAWWAMREALNPALGATLCLPPDDKLARDLTTPHYQVAVSGKIQVEPREDTRRRLGRSTDSGDAAVMAVWTDGAPELDDIPGERARQRPRARQYAASQF